MNSLPPIQEEQIQQFLEQELRGEALTSFQEQLQTDPAFAGIVKERAEMIAVLKAVEALQSEFPHAHAHAHSRPLWLRPRFRAFLIAASVGFLLLASLFWLRFNGSSAPEIAEANFEYRRLNSLLYASRSEANTPIKPKELDSLLYRYQQLAIIDSTNSTLFFTMGDLLFLANQPESAIVSYEKGLQLYPDGLSLFPDAGFALWNLSLSYLKSGNTEEAISILESLKEEESSPYSDRATEILEELRSIGHRWNLR